MDRPGTYVLKGDGVKVVGFSPSRISIATAACTAPLGCTVQLHSSPRFLHSTGTAGSVPDEGIRFLPSDTDV